MVRRLEFLSDINFESCTGQCTKENNKWNFGVVDRSSGYRCVGLIIFRRLGLETLSMAICEWILKAWRIALAN